VARSLIEARARDLINTGKHATEAG